MAEDKKSLPITETPEFKAAVAEAVRAAAPIIAEQVRADLSAKVTQGGDKSLMQELAMHIAELNDQDRPTKRIAPEVLAERAAAHRRAVGFILKAKEGGEKPTYRLTGKVVFNERLIEPFTKGPNGKAIRTEIMWTGMPNHNMVPLNEPAKAIHREFLASVGTPEIIPMADNRQAWMTHNGLIVRGDPPKRMVGGNIVADGLVFQDDVTVVQEAKTGPFPFDPTAEEVHVLGTIAAPAQQNTLPNGASFARPQ